MTPRRPIMLTTGRGPQLLPFALVAVVIGGMAIQSRLLPAQYVPIEIPSTAGIAPGTAPQESVAPPTVAAPVQVLPSESMPVANSSALSDTSVATAAGGARTTEKWADRLPREAVVEDDAGAGNLALHPKQKQPTAITALLANIMASLKRLHPIAPPPVKLLAARGPKPAPNRLKTGPAHVTVASANPHLAGWTLGGPIAPRAVLGGPTPFSARFAPSLNGATLTPRH
jgi:hypothetical protein